MHCRLILQKWQLLKHKIEQKTSTQAYLIKMAGISNLQIEDAIKKIGDKDLLENFVGVFLSNYMNKFINHATMIEDKKRKIPLYHSKQRFKR